MKTLILYASFFLLIFTSIQSDAAMEYSDLDHNVSLYKKKKPLFLLVTGCARTGTTYISLFLRQSGIDVPHESIGADGCVSWMMAADTLHAPYGPGSGRFSFQHTFHQVRDPLKTISSIAMEPEKAWGFVRQNVPEINPADSLLTQCAKYWIYWNRMAEKKAEWTYRIEDLPDLVDEMERRLNRPLDRELLNTLSKNTNGRYADKQQYTWKDLKEDLDPKLYKKLQKLALYYGYPIND